MATKIKQKLIREITLVSHKVVDKLQQLKALLVSEKQQYER